MGVEAITSTAVFIDDVLRLTLICSVMQNIAERGAGVDVGMYLCVSKWVAADAETGGLGGSSTGDSKSKHTI